ncbi:hypothetical protein BCR44DRAFT_1058964 [Catenaria anguillulae PL171]|uniref:UDENN FLCN/SMCR8-type domain-containing protein n=1 Tax=Catenaria anguillulae PL171 TaxID=765915 RepID=A0A1Y2HQ96_9FUNG|nr:hypothetical protein BCR44DRAFT_1058964 [Catenaria anguillulae PL171]
MAHDSLPSPLSPPTSHAHLLGHPHLTHSHATSPPPSPTSVRAPSIKRRSEHTVCNRSARADIMSPPPPSLAADNHVLGHGHHHKNPSSATPGSASSSPSTTTAIPLASQPTATASSAPSSKPLWREPVHLVALVHFCELTGPSIVFVSQPVHGWEVTELAEIHDPIPPTPNGEPPDPAPSVSSSSAIGSTPASSADVGGVETARSRTTTTTSTMSSSSAASSSDSATAPAAVSAPPTNTSVPAYAHHPPTAGPNGAPLTPSAPMCPACHPTLPSSPTAIADLWSICTHAFPSLVPTLSAPTSAPAVDLVPVAAKPALVSPLGAHRVHGHIHDPNPLLVASARYPLRVDLYPVLKSASVRSLSCEVAPSNRAGPLLYTLEVPGFALPFSVVSQAFSLADAASRGGVRAYASCF